MCALICSYNVRGLGNDSKREQIFTWIKENNIDICFLQETHSSIETRNIWKQQWNGHAFFSGKSSNSEGTGILINSKFSCNIVKYSDLIEGRLQALNVKVNDKEITIINIYGPNKDDLAIFNTLENFIAENEEHTFIIGGDFNTVIDPNIDKKNGKVETHKACRQKIKQIMESFDLRDIWRDKNPMLRQFTWHSSHRPPILCRLDYFLISNNLSNSVASCSQKASFKSDHSVVLLKLELKNEEKGPGYFKLNNSLLLDEEYKVKIRQCINEITTINKDANPNTLWELIKGNIRNETIKYATFKKKQNNANELLLINELKTLEKDLIDATDIGEVSRLKQDIDTKKIELDRLTENKLNGQIIRSKAQIVEHGEKNSKYFASLEKKKSESKIISRLNVNGHITTDKHEILSEQKKYYETLYKIREPSNSTINFFDENIPKLSEQESNSCESLIGDQECIKALKEMKNNKSPGSDGITTEFYKIFWPDIKYFYLNSINASYHSGTLTDLQKQSIITLLPKSGKDTCFLSNWRPISLLNVDHKIAAKVIANRIKVVLQSIISNSQTGFMKGRYIGENIRLIFEILQTSDEQNIPGLLFFSDFEKAFDSVNHEYMYKCLKHFSFGNDLINWVKLFYNDAKSCVSNNGTMSELFKIERGVRQGCPLSPYLFIICIELLSNMVMKHEDIRGIKIAGTEFKTSLFADDAAFITDGTRKSFETLINIMDNFSYISGLCLNTSKCQVLRIGSMKIKTIEYFKNRKYMWSSDEARCLGMTFNTNKQTIFVSNLDPKIVEFEKCLQQWQHRKLTLMGKIVVIKNYALPKLIYPLTSLPNPTQDIIKRLEKIMFNFFMGWETRQNQKKHYYSRL